MTELSPTKFSIIIPAYKAENFISYCLESILRQKYPVDRYEVLVIDDKSPDNQNDVITRIIKESKNNGPQIRLLKHSVNKRQGGARNTGIKAAKGKYIIFLDADDYWRRDDVLQTLDFLIHCYPNADIIESSSHIDGREYQRYDNLPINWKDNIRVFTPDEYYSNALHPFIWAGCYKKTS